MTEWSDQWTLGSDTEPTTSSTIALRGPEIYGQQKVEVVPKLEAEQKIELASREERKLPMPPDTLIRVGMLADVEGHGEGLEIERISVTLQPRRDPAAEGVPLNTMVGNTCTAVEVEQIEAALLPYAVFDLGKAGWAYGSQVTAVRERSSDG